MPVSKGRKGVREVMHEFKHHKLHSGSKRGPKVRSRKQAVAIALSQSGLSSKRRHHHRTKRKEHRRHERRRRM